jgi:hypothetical protein
LVGSLFKGTLTRDFRPLFFSSNRGPRPLIHGLKPFWTWLRICGVNRQIYLHSGVIDTAVQPTLSKTFTNDPKHYCFLCGNMIRLHTAQRCHWLHCDMHSGVIDTAVTCKAVSMTPLCKYDTAVTLDLIFEWLWLPLKGISIEKKYIDKLTYTISITFTQSIWELTKDRFLSQWCHWHRCDENRRLHSRFSPRIRSHDKPEVENLVSGSL